jgi:hypothetical protein
MTEFRSRPLWGVNMGLRMSIFLLIFAVFQAQTFRLPLSVFAGVLAAGAAGGFVCGLLLPLARSRLGATLIGPIVLAPLVATQALLDSQYSGEGSYSWSTYLITVVLVDGPSG